MMKKHGGHSVIGNKMWSCKVCKNERPCILTTEIMPDQCPYGFGETKKQAIFLPYNHDHLYT